MRCLSMRPCFFFFQAEDGIRDYKVTGVQTCALPISSRRPRVPRGFGPEGNLRVSEIWDSREQFEAYGKRLMEMPVFADIPFDSGGPPEILEVHKIRKR